MIDSKIISLLNGTLSSIRIAADEKGGWQAIISLYEKAIAKAESNKYFSVQDASRIFLEFNSNYTSDILKLIDKTAVDIEQYFQTLLRSYLESSVSPNRMDAKVKEFSRHTDIYEELINYILAGEQFEETVSVAVEGYTAKRLMNETIVSPIVAFGYLVYLREKPKEALADLKANLPHRKIFNKTDLEEVQGKMDEKITTPVEEVAEPQQTLDETPAEQTALLEKLDAVQQALATLQQSFDDKIAEDAHKNGLFDNMHRELVRYQNGVLDKIVDTIALDIIQLVDSTKGHVRVYEKKEPTEENYKKLLRIVKGIAEDLEDILYRQNIESYRVPGHEVDTRRQKIIQTVPTDDKSKDNLVAVRVADGYEKGDKVLRPERIKIFKYEASSDDPSEK